MLRLRKTNGEVIEVPEGVFVELVNPFDKTLGSVWFQVSKNQVNLIRPGSAEAQRYSQMFGVAFCKPEAKLG